jgi:hypothetical protein
MEVVPPGGEKPINLYECIQGEIFSKRNVRDSEPGGCGRNTAYVVLNELDDSVVIRLSTNCPKRWSEPDVPNLINYYEGGLVRVPLWHPNATWNEDTGHIISLNAHPADCGEVLQQYQIDVKGGRTSFNFKNLPRYNFATGQYQ